MTVPSKWTATRRRTSFTDRLGLAQPMLAAGALAFCTLLFVLPLLYLLNAAFPAQIAPAGLMADYALGALYNEAAASLSGPLSALIAPTGGLSIAGIFVATLGVSIFAWAVAMMLLNQWRAQLPVLEEIVPWRFVVAIVLTLVLISALFWLTRMAGPGVQAAQGLALALLHFGFGFCLILAWYHALVGTFLVTRALLLASVIAAAALTVFVWMLGALIPVGISSVFTKTLFIFAHLFGLWLIIVLGVHYLARQTLSMTDWQDIDELTRGQQVDFALAIMKTLGHGDMANRWMAGQAVAQRLGAKHSLTVQALRRLNEFDLVRASQTTNRPDHWRLSTESLHAINLQDLMEAFGATLDPSNGVYEEGPQPAMLDLADQEKRVFRTDLASLTRGDRGPALTSDAPAFISLITDKGLGTQTDAAGAPAPVGEGSKAYERLTALLEKEAGTSATPASQVTKDFPAFGDMPRLDATRSVGGVAAGTVGSRLADVLAQEEGDVAPAVEVEQIVEQVKAETEEAETGPSAPSEEADAAKSEEQKTEEPRDTAVSAKPLVSTGLTSLVTDLPENLGSYTMALVSPRKDESAPA